MTFLWRHLASILGQSLITPILGLVLTFLHQESIFCHSSILLKAHPHQASGAQELLKFNSQKLLRLLVNMFTEITEISNQEDQKNKRVYPPAIKASDGLFINDVTQIRAFSDTPSPSVTLKWLFNLNFYTWCHKSINSLLPYLRDIINDMSYP